MHGVYYLCNKQSFTRGSALYATVVVGQTTQVEYQKIKKKLLDTVYRDELEVRKTLNNSRPCPVTLRQLDEYFEEV